MLKVARRNQVSRFDVSLDATKIHASAKRHSALSDGHADTTEAHLRAQVQELQELAEQVAGLKVPGELSVPKEHKRLMGRLVASGEAKREIEPRAAKCLVGEQGKYKAKLILRETKAAADVDTAAIRIRVSDGVNPHNQWSSRDQTP